jgi:protein TonB
MAMNLIDRPGIAGGVIDSRHRGMGAITSIAVHAAALFTVIAALRLAPPAGLIEPAPRLVPQHLVWVPHDDNGGGRAGGGDHSIAPVRRVTQIGQDPMTVPTADTQPSTDSATPPPEDVSAIPARPMADATQAFAGTIDGDSATRSAGTGSSGAGEMPGSNRGAGGDRPGDGFGDGATPAGPGVTMPTVIERVSPRYTADAMRARVQGSVLIECVVLRDGSVGDARVMRSLDRHFGLDEEAIAAAKRWRFRPGLLKGQPVPVVVSIELTFSVR